MTENFIPKKEEFDFAIEYLKGDRTVANVTSFYKVMAYMMRQEKEKLYGDTK